MTAAAEFCARRRAAGRLLCHVAKRYRLVVIGGAPWQWQRDYPRALDLAVYFRDQEGIIHMWTKSMYAIQTLAQPIEVPSCQQ